MTESSLDAMDRVKMMTDKNRLMYSGLFVLFIAVISIVSQFFGLTSEDTHGIVQKVVGMILILMLWLVFVTYYCSTDAERRERGDGSLVFPLFGATFMGFVVTFKTDMIAEFIVVLMVPIFIDFIFWRLKGVRRGKVFVNYFAEGIAIMLVMHFTPQILAFIAPE